MLDHEKWKSKAESSGLRGVAEQLENVIALSNEVNKHIEQARRLLEKEKGSAVPEKSCKEKDRD